jgi:hypothetical protein
MHWNIFQSCQPTDLCNDVMTVCWNWFTLSWFHCFNSHARKNRDKRLRATTAPSNCQLWGCKPIPPFAHQRPHLGYPWQDLDRELSANFGYFRCLPSPLRSRRSCRRCSIAGRDKTTVVTPRINWPIQINVIIVAIAVMQTYSDSYAPQMRKSDAESFTWFPSNNAAYHFSCLFIICEY